MTDQNHGEFGGGEGMGEWGEGVLSDIAEIIMGQSPSGDTCNSNGVGIPLLNGPTEFGVKFPTPAQFTTDPKKISAPNDILFCVRGSTTGRMNWANQKYALSRGLAGIRHKYGKEYRYFVKGIIDFNLPLLLASATGSTFPNVSRDQLKELAIFLPPLLEQKAIASILSSLDDKIDLLHRQNKTLEALAETLFRQWFIEEAGDEWERKSLLDIIELVGGGTPKTSVPEYWDGEIPWLSGGDIASNHKSFIISSEKAITQEGLDKSSAKVLPKFATVISARGTVGKYALLSKPTAYSQSNYGILPKIKNCYFFTYLLINYAVSELQCSAYGSVFDTITTSTFRDVSFLFPPENSIKEFEVNVSAYFVKKLHCLTQIRALEKLRDELLPKLMNGEIRTLI